MSSAEVYLHQKIKSVFIPEKFKKHFGKFWHKCSGCGHVSKTKNWQETCSKCGELNLIWIVTEQGVPIPSIHNKELLA